MRTFKENIQLLAAFLGKLFVAIHVGLYPLMFFGSDILAVQILCVFAVIVTHILMPHANAIRIWYFRTRLGTEDTGDRWLVIPGLNILFAIDVLLYAGANKLTVSYVTFSAAAYLIIIVAHLITKDHYE